MPEQRAGVRTRRRHVKVLNDPLLAADVLLDPHRRRVEGFHLPNEFRIDILLSAKELVSINATGACIGLRIGFDEFLRYCRNVKVFSHIIVTTSH